MASDYWLSSQCNHWLFSRSQLITARAEDLRYADSPDDVAAIGIWTCNAIAALTKRLSQRQRVTATACIFFRRFYAKIGNSYCSTDPAMVATACFYIAAKIEETPVHVRVVASEAAKLWSELGHPSFPSDVSSLGQMEFYLLEDLDFHLIVHHPYRVLLTFSNNVGKIALSKLDDDFGGSIGMDLNTHTAGKEGLGLGLGMDVESEDARLGDAFVLNDTYRTDIGLLYPPHLIAIAALYLGFTLHQPSRDSLVASAEKMRERRRKWAAAAAALSHPSNQDSGSVGGSESAEQHSDLPPPPVPPPDALSFFAALNVDFRLVAEVVQHILAGYEVWHRIDHASTARTEQAPQSHMDGLEDGKDKGATQTSTSNGSGTSSSVLSDGPAMFAKLHRMRERRRLELNLLNER
ncbi:cyclin-like protein [Ceraceosorus guamensis]|uniref:Cyclin-like protein n=1 Tax=Ceraceosorus guamensis TaxID=1522189 RepID=A0A316VMC2_9BASI|nr:cyclin-like protein [Ceraceosorus guamensis]PWN38687.1 cyclin-like protein [Ceraceosorus guamensis]